MAVAGASGWYYGVLPGSTTALLAAYDEQTIYGRLTAGPTSDVRGIIAIPVRAPRVVARAT
jgi:hypothetical protein